MCLFTRALCVAVGKRTHALRVVVELSGNEKAPRLYIETWVRAQQPGWPLHRRLEPFGFCCRGGPAPLLDLDRLVRSPEQAQSLTEPEIHPSSLIYTHTRTLLLFTVALFCGLECQTLGILSCDRCSRNRRRISPFSLSVSTQGLKSSPSLPLALSTKLFPPASQDTKTLIGMS